MKISFAGSVIGLVAIYIIVSHMTFSGVKIGSITDDMMGTTVNITGAPIETFRFRIHPSYQNPDFTGLEVRDFSQDPQAPGVYVVRFKDKISSDATLMVRYTHPLPERGGAFNSRSSSVRAAYRYWFDSRARNDGVGFRVVIAPRLF